MIETLYRITGSDKVYVKGGGLLARRKRGERKKQPANG
jgi:hypothetical protein